MHVTPIQRLMGLMARLRTEGSIRGLGERSKNVVQMLESSDKFHTKSEK